MKECAVLVVSGSAQRRVLSMRPTPVHRQWVASVCEETTAVVLVVDGCEQGAGARVGVDPRGMRREKTKWASGVQRLRPGDAMQVAVKRWQWQWQLCGGCAWVRGCGDACVCSVEYSRRVSFSVSPSSSPVCESRCRVFVNGRVVDGGKVWRMEMAMDGSLFVHAPCEQASPGQEEGGREVHRGGGSRSRSRM